MEGEDRQLSSSIRLLERIEDEPLWKDLKVFLQDTIEQSMILLKTSQDMSDILREQGVIATCETILELPETWRESLVYDKQEEERNV